MLGAGKVFVFFNCDDNKNESSMNIFYNNKVYRDTRTSRKKLWQKIKSEIEDERIRISEENLPKAEKAILNGDPVMASDFIQFGAIKSFDCF